MKSFNAKFSNYILGEATDVEGLKRIQVLKTGTFTDPRYGKFEITTKMLSEMIDNFKKGIRGVVPALDFDHNEGRAAGWIKNLFLSEDGTKLYADVELSGSGKQAIEAKDYGYVSAEFVTKYKDNESQKTHGIVLLGAALTNRPCIKGMESVLTLSETDKPKEKAMNEEQMKLLESMGFKSLEDLCAAYKAMKEKMDTELSASAVKEGEMKKLSESFTDSEKKLSEANEKIKTLEAQVATSAKEQEFSKLLSEGKAVPAQKEAFLKGDVAEFAKHAGSVKLNENGGSGDGKDTTDEDALVEKATKLSEEKKISFREAYKQVKGGK